MRSAPIQNAQVAEALPKVSGVPVNTKLAMPCQPKSGFVFMANTRMAKKLRLRKKSIY